MKKTRTITRLIGICALLFALALTLASCGECEHTYTDLCDTSCNECGESRTAPHDYADATCTLPSTCKDCGATTGDSLGHAPLEDDGDCTTSVPCDNCDEPAIPARDAHEAGEDDGDCLTEVICKHCTVVVIPADQNHDIDPEYKSDSELHWHECKRDNCTVHLNEGEHAGEDDGDCTTPVICSTCKLTLIEAKESHTVGATSLDCEECEKTATVLVKIDGKDLYLTSITDALLAVADTTESNPATVRLLDNYTSSKPLSANGYFTLDLNGNTIENTADYSYVIMIKSGYLTIVDTADDGTLKSQYGVSVLPNAGLTISSGTIDSSVAYGIQGHQNSTIVIEGTATVKCDKLYGVSTNTASLYIKGGTLQGKIAILYTSPKEIIISGGTIIGSISNNGPKDSIHPLIIGGSFPGGIALTDNCAPIDQLIGGGHGYFINDEPVTVEAGAKKLEGSIVVKKFSFLYDEAINTYYVSTAEGFAQAIAEAQLTGTADNVATIKLTDSISYVFETKDAPAFTIESGVVALDLNGYTFDLIAADGVGIKVKSATLIVNDSAGGGKYITNSAYVLSVSTQGSLTVNGGHFETTYDRGFCVHGFEAKSIIINGGSFKTNWVAINPQNTPEFVFSGGSVEAGVTAISLRDNTWTIIGGTFNGGEQDFAGDPTGKLGFDPETGEGAYFPGGLTLYYGTLQQALAEGAGYFDANGNQITEGLDGQIIEGDVYVKRIPTE
ncbi:MAG: hypothetical protein IJE25_04070 [Clostridia bacterium]|nr:hypothetical protein [Clostridia bacterium]